MKYPTEISVKDRTRINWLRTLEAQLTSEWYQRMSGELPWVSEAEEKLKYADQFANISLELKLLRGW